MEEFTNGAPPPYDEVTRKTIRVVKYGSMEQNEPAYFSKQVSEDRVQPPSEDVYMTDRNFDGDKPTSTNPFR